jgi:signal transduction histidine kinase/DNA-binding response OmpR family regulator
VVVVAAAAVAAALGGPRPARPWWVAGAAFAAGLLVLLTPLNGILSRGLLDHQLRQLTPAPPNTAALVFDIDDASLAALKPQLGPWPFKRDVYAMAVQQLRELGARAIAVDLLLADAQPGDAAFARVIAQPGAPVILAAAGLHHLQDLAPPRSGTTAPSAAKLPAHPWPSIALPSATVWPEGTWPRLGVITTPLDDDGVLRRLPLWHQSGELKLPVLPLAVVEALRGADATAPIAAAADRQGALHLALPAREAAAPLRPFSELMAVAWGQKAAATLRPLVDGRVVFIGSSALLADVVMTVNGQASGVDALAQAYTAIQDAAWVRPPLWWADAALLLVAVLPALWVARRGRAEPTLDLATSSAALALLAGLALTALVVWRLPTSWGAPLVALATGLLAAMLSHQRQQSAKERALAQELAVAAETARAKSAFLATVSHEVRTPLNAMLGVAELLDESELQAQQKQHVQVFRESGQALLDLINDLLDLSKIESGKLSLDAEPFSLHHLLTHLMSLMQPRAQVKGLQIHLEVAPGLPDGVLGDRSRLRQGLMNLLGNAIKFTPQGEVRLRVLQDDQMTHTIRFEVSDSGIGIAPSKLESIFEPFAQADTSVTRQFGGTGLGLSITRSVAQLMGGSVQVRSTPGLGSVFTLTLPLAPAELPQRREALQAARLPQGEKPMSVLLAEDNEVNIYLFQAMVQDQPIELEVAPNGTVALEMLRRRAYDLAFIDIQMPGLDGLSVTRALRHLEATSARPRTPVVALTANAYASDVHASLAAGCEQHMSKPFTKAQLLEAMGAVRPGTDAEPDASARAAAAATQRQVVDFAGARARLGGDPSLYARLADHGVLFLQDWSLSFESARADAQRPPSVQHAMRLVHDLKGISASLGAMPLSELAASLEAELKRSGLAAVSDEAVAQVHRTIPAVLAAIRQEPGAG